MTSDSSNFPYAQIEMGKVAILFEAHLEDWRDWTEHVPLHLPPPDAEKVVIAVDGLGSSSAGLYLPLVTDYLEELGFQICNFSYRGIATHFYQPEDTAKSAFEDLVKHLGDYIQYFKAAQDIVLLGYSFGGLVIAEWLYRQAEAVQDIPALRGSILLASPIRIRSTRIKYRRELEKTKGGRAQIANILWGYTAIPEHVPPIASLFVFRCARDGLLDSQAYSFADLPAEHRPIEEELDADHTSILSLVEMYELVMQSAGLLCAN